MNEIVIPIHPVVPNSYTVLTQVPGDAQYFSVLGLMMHFSVFPYNNIKIHNISLTLSGWTLTFWRILSTAGQYCHGVLWITSTFWEVTLAKEVEN